MTTFIQGLAALCVLATLLEAGVAWYRQRRIYSLRELSADLRCAAVAFGLVIAHRGAFLALFTLIHARFGFSWGTLHPATYWLACFVLYDLVYYVDHRATHRFDWLWASHQVHHQSRAYHLLTGLRMSVYGPLLGYPFRLPLALVVDPLVYLSVDVVHNLLTYLLHARFVGKLGPISWIFNTPAHHRIHHSANPEHFDRNYGGVLLIWDRLFGTYLEPTPVSRFGDGETREALGPWRAHIEPWRSWWSARRARETA